MSIIIQIVSGNFSTYLISGYCGSPYYNITPNPSYEVYARYVPLVYFSDAITITLLFASLYWSIKRSANAMFNLGFSIIIMGIIINFLRVILLSLMFHMPGVDTTMFLFDYILFSFRELKFYAYVPLLGLLLVIASYKVPPIAPTVEKEIKEAVETKKKVPRESKKVKPIKAPVKPVISSKFMRPIKVNYVNKELFTTLPLKTQAIVESFLSSGNYDEAYNYIVKNKPSVRASPDVLLYIPPAYRQRFLRWFAMNFIMKNRPDIPTLAYAGSGDLERAIITINAYIAHIKGIGDEKKLRAAIHWKNQFLAVYGVKLKKKKVTKVASTAA